MASRLHVTFNPALDMDYLLKKAQGLEPKEYNVYFFDSKKRRTLNQLRYYWGVILKAAEDYTGYDKEDIHEFMKSKFGKRTILSIGSNSFETLEGFRRMSKQDATEFIDKVTRFWTEKGVVISSMDSLSEEQYVEAFNEESQDN